jgi:[ribosomal protein S5]-alanine N-acetyltransferase
MPIPLPILTERVLIRPFTPDTDARQMVRVYCDPEVMRFIPGGALADEEAVRSLLDTYARTQEERGFSSWALIERDTGELVGDVGFGIFDRTGEIELGYTLARDYWGRGLATEAAGAALASGLAHLEVRRVIAVVDAENHASLRVPQRLGMRRVGDVEVYGRRHVLFARNVLGGRLCRRSSSRPSAERSS